ncbi:MAG: hypothetical protein ACRDTG_04495 [Pseudonocardiaceae bacterium]
MAELAALLVILSGGLRPENVVDAVEAVRPFAVDVNSGVEDAGGNKDVNRSFQFVAGARGARIFSGFRSMKF